MADASAQPPLLLPSLGLQVRVPAGWEATRSIDGRGVSLGLPGSNAPGLDVVVWEPVAGTLSARDAALAHERVLAVSLNYRQVRLEDLPIATGIPAVLVMGRAVTPQGEQADVVFAAYALGARYCVLGTFCELDGAARCREAFFDEAARTLSPAGTALPGEEPVTPPVAVVDVPAAEPTATDPPPADPVPPSSTQPLMGETREYRGELGFALSLPENWEISLNSGCIFAGPRERPRRAGIAVWPVVRAENAPIEKRALALAREWAPMLGTRWQNTSTRLEPGFQLAALLAGVIRVDDQRVQAIALFTGLGPVDLLQVAYFASDVPPEDRVKLADIMSTFSMDGMWVADVEPGQARVWVDREGAIEADLPLAWSISGGVQLYNETPVIAISGVHPQTGARFSWRQPEMPMFRELTPLLSASGWRVGAQFPPDFGAQPLVLEARPTAEELSRRRVGGNGGSGWEVTVAGPAPNASALLPGGQAAFARGKTAETQASCLCAVAPGPGSIGADLWMAATLRYEGKPGALNAAGAALRTLIEAVRRQPYWPASKEQRETLDALLAGAREAARDLPETGSDAPDESGTRSVFAETVAAGTDGATRVVIPSGEAVIWGRATTADTAREGLPELLEQW